MEITLILSGDWIKTSNEFSEYARQITRYGIHKREYTKQQEQQSSDFERRISLKDGGKVLKGNGYSTLLGFKERDNLLQDKTMSIPCTGAQANHILSERGLLRGEKLCPWVPRATKDWIALR